MADGLVTISLWQPWASLIAIGAKTIETRSWSTKHRGPLAIHAAKTTKGLTLGSSLEIQEAINRETGGDYLFWDDDLPFGAIVATCTLADIVPTESLVPCIDVGPRGWGIQAIGRVPLIDPDQWPYGDYSPGRYGWLLADIVPVTKRCPRCDLFDDAGSNGTIHDPNWCGDEDHCSMTITCPVCHGDGNCDPIPAKGRQGLWRWRG